jgi:hypothetical protein
MEKSKIPAKTTKTEEKIQCYKYSYGKFLPNGYIIQKKDGSNR